MEWWRRHKRCEHRIIVLGAGGHAKTVLDALQRSGETRAVGLLDDRASLQGAEVCGARVLGTLDSLMQRANETSATACVAAIGDNDRRREVVARSLQTWPDVRYAVVLHPSVQLGRGACIGEGSVLCAGVIVGPDARIGRHCILNTGSSLDHDSVMGDFASLAPRATVGGSSTIGEGAAVCMGACISHGCTVGERALIGAGSVVLRHVPANCLAHGVPARMIRERTANDPSYLTPSNDAVKLGTVE
ncbi:PglD O-acyltransferase [uncultured virus]|nr:PglD O-acyltransferase [uncultured virus]